MAMVKEAIAWTPENCATVELPRSVPGKFTGPTLRDLGTQRDSQEGEGRYLPTPISTHPDILTPPQKNIPILGSADWHLPLCSVSEAIPVLHAFITEVDIVVALLRIRNNSPDEL